MLHKKFGKLGLVFALCALVLVSVYSLNVKDFNSILSSFPAWPWDIVRSIIFKL